MSKSQHMMLLRNEHWECGDQLHSLALQVGGGTRVGAIWGARTELSDAIDRPMSQPQVDQRGTRNQA
jgi:hypothetical protein